MELPSIPLTPGHPALAAGPAAPAPGNPDAPDASATPAPGFAELLAADLALSAGAGDAAVEAPPAIPGLKSPDADHRPCGQAASAAPDSTLALLLASIALPAAAHAPAATASAGDASRLVPAQNASLEPSELTPPAVRTERATGPASQLQLAARETEAAPAGPMAHADAVTAAPVQLAAAQDAAAQAAAAQTATAQAATAHTLHAAPVHAAAAAGELHALVGADGWDTQLGRSLVWMANERQQVAELRLNPPDLGPLQVVLRLSGDDGGQASVVFASPHADVRAALETALPRLRDMFAESGIALGQASVNAESFRDAGGAVRQEPGRGDVPGSAGATLALTAPAMRAGAGLVDTFA